jgi:hypothetical protein
MPTTSIFIVPFAMLPWEPAHLLWAILTAGILIVAGFLMWNLGANYAPGISCGLICFILANTESIFGTGNTAGIVVGLCVVAVWCFLRQRFVLIGIICLAVSLAMKPHDAGLIWLYFLLAGGAYRRRAVQALLVTAAFGLSAYLWVEPIAPHWMQELHSNLLVTSAPGGSSNPGDTNSSSRGPSMILDLQSTISAVRDDPQIYNPVSYLVCGTLLLVWWIHTLRSGFSQRRAWLALAAVVPLTMLVTYHRPYDAKLLLLTVPACAMLWAEGGFVGQIALLLNTAGIVFTADVPLVVLDYFTESLHTGTTGIFGQILTVVLVRPVPLVLLAVGVFYLWVYVWHDSGRVATEAVGSEKMLAPTSV